MRGAFLLSLAAACFAQTRQVSDADVMKVHRAAVLIDTHNDVPMRTVRGFDIGKRASSGQTDLPRMREGGVGAQFFAAYVPGRFAASNQSAHQALTAIDTIRRDIIARYPNDYVLATTAEQILAARKSGKIAALIGIEGGHAIEDDLRLLRTFHDLGVRYMTLTHSNTNNWADSSGDVSRAGIKHHNGLTEFGRQVVREMNRLGMMVDISHVADKTFWDALETSRAPVFASHSSCRALSNVPRNMTDDMIRALAKKGGVIQINFACEFLSQRYRDGVRPFQAERRRIEQELAARYPDHNDRYQAVEKRFGQITAQVPPPTIDDVVAHIDHVRRIAGIDAVGLGSDFDGIGECVPKGLEDVSKFPNLTRKLLEKGYTSEDIHKIYGGNTLRVMRAVERAAQQ